jgi:two-component system, NarL family, response regulator LiaR
LIPDKSSGDGRTGEPIEPILSERQREVLELVALGYSNDEIAERLHLSTRIVEGDITDIVKALGVRDRTSAAVVALRMGLID